MFKKTTLFQTNAKGFVTCLAIGLFILSMNQTLQAYNVYSSLESLCTAQVQDLDKVKLLSKDASNTTMRNSVADPFIQFISSAAMSSDAGKFITRWKTDNPGVSASNEIRIPGFGSNYLIEWEEEGNPSNNGSETGNGATIITFPSAGIYIIKISEGAGDFHRIGFGNSGDRLKLLSIDQWGDIVWSSMVSAFWGCANLDCNATDVPNLSVVTNMDRMFQGCTNLNGPDNIGSWNTSNVTRMFAVFYGASTFNQDISGWDVSNVWLMQSLFNGATAFNQDISDWDVSKVTDMFQLFQNASSFNQDIGGWDVSSATDMTRMFASALAFNQPIGNWNVSNVTTMTGMFSGANSFNQNLSNWDVSTVSNMVEMFRVAASYNQSLGCWNLRNNVNMLSMLNFSGMDCATYSATLIGWSENPNTPNNRFVGARTLQYGTNAVAARNLLLAKGWAIQHDSPSSEECLLLTEDHKFITRWKTDNPGVSGTNQIRIPGYGNNYTIEWEEEGNPGNNGSETGNGETTITFPSAGIYIIKISEGVGDFHRIRFNNGGDRLKLISIDQWGDIAWSSMEEAFWGCANMTYAAIDAPNLSHVTLMNHMFQNCASFNGNLNNWNVSNVTRMNNLFSGCTIFNGNISSWDVSNVWDMSSMFLNCNDFNTYIGDWDVSNVSNMFVMFGHAREFNQNIGNWNTSSLTAMLSMFLGASSFNQPIGSWDVSKVTNMSQVFYGASSFNQNINDWDVSKVTTTINMFWGASSFNQNLDSWDVSKVTRMDRMFIYASSFNGLIGSWDVSNVTNMDQMFMYALAFNQPIGNWDVSNVTSMNSMFSAAFEFNQDISDWDVSKVTDMFAMFDNAYDFNQDIGNWDVSKVTNLSRFFAYASQFNQDIGNWDVSNATLMNSMFGGASQFNQDIGNWDVSNVTDMRSMFSSASNFNQDIKKWDVNNVMDMAFMFNGAMTFNQNLGGWDLNGNVDINGMFSTMGMDCKNYSATLIGWSNNPDTPTGRNLGAHGRQYGANAITARNSLLAKGWTISGDFPAGTACTLCPELLQAPTEVSFINSNCEWGCTIGGGSISAPAGNPCPAGSILQYQDNGGAWSDILPVYAQEGPAQTIKTRCICEDDPTVISPESDGVTTQPGACSTPDPSISSPHGLELDCNNPQTTLSVAQATSYQWTRDLQPISSEQSILVTTSGLYAVTVTDAYGCTAQEAVQVVFYPDTLAPVVTCQDIVVALDPSGQVGIVPEDVFASGSDNCGTVILEAVQPAQFACGEVGANTVTLTVHDNNGNVATCSATVTVEDNVNPEALCQNITLQLDVNGQATITAGDIDNGSHDACGIASLALSQVDFACEHVGENEVTLTVTDHNGNAATCEATVTVHDNVAPTAVCQHIAVVLNEEGEAAITPADIDGGSHDACGIASLALDVDAFSCDHIGDVEVLLFVTDHNGNVATCQAVVTVADLELPEIYCPADTVLACIADVPPAHPGSAIAIDNCPTEITLVETNNGGVGCSTSPLAITRTFTATDPAGNSATCSQLIRVEATVQLGGSCFGCDASMTVYWDCEESNCVMVTACKDLSNIVLEDCAGNHYKFDKLKKGKTGTFCHPSGLPVVTVWVKAGCYASGDGPGYGRRFNAPCNYCPPPQNPRQGQDPVFTVSAHGMDVHVYPNPTGGQFSIMVRSAVDTPARAEVFDLVGRKVYEVNGLMSNQAHQIDHPLAPGAYIIRIEHEGVIEVARLIKQD